MGRRRKLGDAARVRMFLEAVADHPWASLSLIRAYSGLYAWEIDDVAQPLAEKRGWIEQGRIATPAGRVPPRRFGLTPAGAAAIGRPFNRPFMGQVLLSALKLDSGRRLLTEFVGEVECMPWSLSPYYVSVKDLRPPRKRMGRLPKSQIEGDYAYRTLCLDGLACLKFASGSYLNVAVLVDPGGIKLEWFFHQFRSFHAWAYRSEFRDRLRAVPLLMVIAANDASRAQLIRLWREASPWGMNPKRLRITTAGRQARHWWDERGQMRSLWGAVATFESPSQKPKSHIGGWWGQLATQDEDTDSLSASIQLRVKRPGVISWANGFKPRLGKKLNQDEMLVQLIRLHLCLSLREREFLAALGRYPLASKSELSVILRRVLTDVSHGFERLQAFQLVERTLWDKDAETAPAPGNNASPKGYVLTWLGVTLLAAQVGFFEPSEYARLMNWPVKEENAQLRYSVEAWLTNAEHYRTVLDFLVGLRRAGKSHRLALFLWDHLDCQQEMPTEVRPLKGRGWRLLRQAWVIPDATGTVRAFGAIATQYVDTPFWLEVDRRGQRGKALWEKLNRYYKKGGAVGRSPRLLIVVARDNEARLQSLRRRLLVLNERYGRQLDVRLTRLDLLTDEKGKLDPARRVWRRPEASEFVEAFDRPLTRTIGS